ncbi:RES family NAD+ phosphorylase [Adhaeribacter radiodurans]|uniref:RES family NAD+ phosphorylase n=1 Tax=Adhaeribacter radiodurans TaxID=2745197 RepID=A0A7L7L5H5_9BACT|nr:RES family NAD+ phosphorylase [Adhaeribacter radiodurans]QMU28061.1 RES family NAD+ phosphorylase [Adhaeribacter radiodurans]
MIVFRLSKQLYCTDLSGTGAFKAGGRWNSKGTALVYTADSRALSMAEVAVHIPVGMLPKDYFLVSIAIPDDFISEVDRNSLPPDWNVFPHPISTQQFGDNFVKTGKSLILKVPSAVVPGDFNYLINPQHPSMNQVSIVGEPTPFPFDNRLFQKK